MEGWRRIWYSTSRSVEYGLLARLVAALTFVNSTYPQDNEWWQLPNIIRDFHAERQENGFRNFDDFKVLKRGGEANNNWKQWEFRWLIHISHIRKTESCCHFQKGRCWSPVSWFWKHLTISEKGRSTEKNQLTIQTKHVFSFALFHNAPCLLSHSLIHG